MCKREKGLSNDKTLALHFLSFFGPWPGDKSNILFFAEELVVKPMKITNHEKIDINMRGIVGNSKEYFCKW